MYFLSGAQRTLQKASIRQRKWKPNYALRRCVVQEERSKRINPFGSLGRRTIGSVYSAVDSGYSLGKGGLELAFDKHLRGELGSSVEIYNEGKKVSNTVREPRRGAECLLNVGYA